MTKKIVFSTISVLFLTLISLSGQSQILKKLTDKVKKFTDKVNELAPRPNSEIRKKDFFQLPTPPPFDTSNTRVPIAKNLFIDIKGKYPKGYKPKWRSITYNPEAINFNVENWVAPGSVLQTDPRYMSIGDMQGRVGLRFSAFISCDCFADIVIKDSIAVITDKPQTFKVTNFRKILNERVMGEECKSSTNNMYTDGGVEGKITLSANENGDINMDLVIEFYTVGYQPSFQKEYIPSQVSYKYFVKNFMLENEMSAEKATAIVREEEEAKQRQKDYLVKTTKQADSIKKIIAKKFPQSECRDCFVRSSNSNLKITPTKTIYRDGYGDYYSESGTDWDINTKIGIKNNCGYTILFVGIQQLYDEEKGYYLKEITKEMPKGYSYDSEQGLMGSLFTSLIGGGSEFNFQLQDKYYPQYASVGSVQWLKVIRKL